MAMRNRDESKLYIPASYEFEVLLVVRALLKLYSLANGGKAHEGILIQDDRGGTGNWVLYFEMPPRELTKLLKKELPHNAADWLEIDKSDRYVDN